MGKNVAVFVDVANIFYAAKAAGADIDYVLLLKAATAGRDLVRAYAYTGLDPDNENQRNFHSFLSRHDFRVVSKDIRKYGDGKVKANLDIELVVDMMKTARNLDVAVVVSGDGDFAPAIRAVQEMGVRVEVISFRGNTSSDLMDVADKFTDITQLAKVERESTVSGRRVPSDDEDLSMTEVPDKLSEGTGHGRGRGRGRVRVEREPVAASRPVVERAVRAPRTRRVEAIVADERGPVDEVEEQVAIVALPGEKLSKARTVRAAAPAPVPAEPAATDDEEAIVPAGAEGAPSAPETEGDEDAPRRRRRRGGRGRGRGRGQEGGVETAADGAAEPLPVAALAADDAELEFEVDDESIPAPRPAPRPAAFGSVWDSQIGVAAPVAGRPAAEDEEFDDEPEIPEYLLAERRNRGGQGARGGQPIQGNRGGRGRAGSYAAAIDRERYGRGGAPSSAGGSVRFGEPAGRGGVSRDAGPRRDVAPRRDAAPRRDMGRPVQARPERLEGRSGSSEPWSEVPPELEELLKAQLAQKLGRQAETRPAAGAAAPVESATAHGDAVAAEADASTPARGRGRRRAAGAAASAVDLVAAPIVEKAPESAPAPVRRRRATGAAASAAAPILPATLPVEPTPEVAAAPKRRAARPKAAAAVEATPAAPVEAAAPATPKRRAPRAAAASVAPTASAADAPASADVPAPKRRYVRKAAAPVEGA
ncbi:MAG TPA: NYN domain-containing protein [Candidatus Limnocylindrales bacterium]